MKPADPKFWLTSFFDETVQETNDYKWHKLMIKHNGYSGLNIDGKTIKMYRPELAVLLTSQELPARNMKTQTETTIDCWEYLQTYIEAYKEGEHYFETEFKLLPNNLYGANAETYVRNIHYNFFHTKIERGNNGWGYVKKTYPVILTHEEIKRFGYYSGIVSKVEEQIKKHPNLFATFDKCNHEIAPTPKQDKQIPILAKPILKPEAVEIVFSIIKDFFSLEQQTELKQILETGKDASQHLVFLDSGNRLADAFKQLKKADVITGCEQKELESWIHRNFKYKYREKPKEFTLRYLNDIISTNKDKCQKPILNVKIIRSNGEISITKA